MGSKTKTELLDVYGALNTTSTQDIEVTLDKIPIVQHLNELTNRH